MSRKRTGLQSCQGSATRRKAQIVIVVTVVVSLFAAWTMMAYSGALDQVFSQKAEKKGPVSLASFTSPSKEYVYAGGRLVATEEPQSSLSPGLDTIGLYNPATSAFFLRNSNSTRVADLTFAYGLAGAGWIPMAGDWNGDGTDTIGLYNPTTSTFFLSNSNSSAPADLVFSYGPAGAGWLPIGGDWNGDGTDTIGLYNPTASTFFLRNSNSTSVADLTFAYGPPGTGWLPITGDWNGDGADTIGLYNPTTSTFFLSNSNSSAPADLVFGYGPAGAGWIPLVGDWNGDGTDTIGLYNPTTSTFFLSNSNSSAPADLTLYGNLSSFLRSTTPVYSTQTLKQLFPELNGAQTTYNPTVVSAVYLPDGRSFQFRYNPYGEVEQKWCSQRAGLLNTGWLRVPGPILLTLMQETTRYSGALPNATSISKRIARQACKPRRFTPRASALLSTHARGRRL